MNLSGINKQTSWQKVAHCSVSPEASDLCEVAQEVTRARDEVRHRLTSEAAYYRAQQRGFEPGHELDDWVLAEHDAERALQTELCREAGNDG